MHKKLTITIDEEVYKGLQEKIGRGRISQFLEDLARPFVLPQELDKAYRDMSADEEREQEALEWAEGTVGEVGDETR